MKIILASNSPRRKELLTKAGVDFTVIPSTEDENINKNLPPIKYAETLSYLKAKSVFDKHKNIVIGADTIVVFNDKIIGKPKDEKDAFLTLKSLSNNTHKVITAYTIISQNKLITDHEVTKVTFNNLSDNLIIDYIKKIKPYDKAGSYGIQDGYPLVKSYDGDYDNIVGLPTQKIINLLKEFKWKIKLL